MPGAQDVDTTRATYFAGKAAMVVWSSFILDEMAGLRNDALPTCPQCKADPAFLAKNSGVVTAIAGPVRLEPAQFGEITSWTITAGRPNTDAGEEVRRVHDERRLHRLARHRARGQVPGPQRAPPRTPTSSPTRGTTLKAGVDTKAPLANFYPPGRHRRARRAAPTTFDRWAIPQGQGDLLGATWASCRCRRRVNAVIERHEPAAGRARPSRPPTTIKDIQQ